MERFFEANQAYKTGRFQEAANAYIRLIEEGHENGHLFYNLGNACFQIGELGKAILYYEKASLLIPRDADLSFNLSHARSRTQDAVSPPTSALFSKLLGLDSFNFHEIFLVFTVLNVMLFSVLGFRLFKVHAGTIVHYDRAEDDWVLLQLSESKRGWVRNNQIQRIVK